MSLLKEKKSFFGKTFRKNYRYHHAARAEVNEDMMDELEEVLDHF